MRRRNGANQPIACTYLRISWIRSRATSAVSHRACIDWEAPIGRRPRVVPDVQYGKLPVNSYDSMRHAQLRSVEHLARIPPGSANWKMPFRTSKHPTNLRVSMRSRPIWRSRSRWTELSAAMLAMARPKLLFVRHSKRSRTALRWQFLCPLHCLYSNTYQPSVSVMLRSRSRWPGSHGSSRMLKRKRSWQGLRTAPLTW